MDSGARAYVMLTAGSLGGVCVGCALLSWPVSCSPPVLYSYAGLHNLDKDLITLLEVRAKLNEFQQSCLWATAETRAALWHECQQMLLENGCAPETAGNFFLEKAGLAAEEDQQVSTPGPTGRLKDPAGSLPRGHSALPRRCSCLLTLALSAACPSLRTQPPGSRVRSEPCYSVWPSSGSPARRTEAKPVSHGRSFSAWRIGFGCSTLRCVCVCPGSFIFFPSFFFV